MKHVSEPKRNPAMTNTARAARSGPWLAHALVVALVVGYIGLSALLGTPDANIGLGLGLLALGTLGAPWTLPLLMSEEVTLDSGLFLAIAAGGTALNLALHAVFRGRLRERFGRDR
jgi:hypothetical protein